jgi:hypothetical protein
MTNARTSQYEAQMDRFGLKVVAALDDQPLPHDISERLRIARQQALAQRKTQVVLQTQSAGGVFASGSAAVLGQGDERSNWLGGLLGSIPLVALAIGLVAISINVSDERANELAEVDTQLLTDELPPGAHVDPGFTQYLKFGPPAASDAVKSGSGQ